MLSFIESEKWLPGNLGRDWCSDCAPQVRSRSNSEGRSTEDSVFSGSRAASPDWCRCATRVSDDGGLDPHPLPQGTRADASNVRRSIQLRAEASPEVLRGVRLVDLRWRFEGNLAQAMDPLRTETSTAAEAFLCVM